MSKIADLLNIHNTATQGQSAQTNGANPVSDFIATLAKYAQPVEQGITNAANTFGKALGQQSPIPGITPNYQQLAQKNNLTVPNDFLSGNVQNIPSTIKNNITTNANQLASGDIKSQAGLVAGTIGGGEEGASPIEEGLPPIRGAEKEIPSNKPSMITKNKIDPKANAAYQSIFQVPRNIAQNMSVKPETVVNQLVEDGVKGVRNLDQLEQLGNNVTGETGAFPQINNYILSKVKEPVDYSDALTGANNLVNATLKGEKPGLAHEVVNEINKQMQEAGLTPAIYETPNGYKVSEGGISNAQSLFQASQNLKGLGYMYKRKAYTSMGDLNHPELERIGNNILDLQNSIDDSLDTATKDNYASFKNDPFVQQQLQRLPQGIKDRFMQGADRFKHGQTIQAPYYNLLKMVEDTKDAQLSAFTKALQASQSTPGSEGLSSAVTSNMPGPKILKTVMGGALKNMAKPFDKTAEDYMQENTSGGVPNAGKGGLGKTVKTIAGLGAVGVAGAGLESLKNSSNAQSQNPTNLSDNNHTNTVASPPLSVNSQLETDMSKVDPSSPPADPRTVTGSDGHSIAMSDGQYQTAKAALDSLVKQDPSYITNPIKAGQLKAAQDAIDTKYSASQNLMKSYQKVTTISQKIADAKDLLTQTSPALIDKIGMLEPLHEMVDPKYQSLVNDLNFIENSDPRLKGQLSNLATKGSVQTALDNAAKLLLSEHNQLLKSYGAGNSQGTAANQPPPVSQMPAGLPAPVNGQLPPMQGGSYQFTPPNPLFQ